MSYQWLLFDADGTLFDYDNAEEHALQAAFAAAQVPFLPKHGEVYREVNHALWGLFEQRKIELADLRVRRFAELFKKTGLQLDAEAFSQLYLNQLGREISMIPGANELLDHLYGRYQLALITNGISQVQRSRLKLAGLEGYFEDVFISEEIGTSKPDPAYFDVVFAGIHYPPKETVLVIGDSLSSDIRGGNNYGLDTCWFNPQVKALSDGLQVTYEVRSLPEILDILD